MIRKILDNAKINPSYFKIILGIDLVRQQSCCLFLLTTFRRARQTASAAGNYEQVGGSLLSVDEALTEAVPGGQCRLRVGVAEPRFEGRHVSSVAASELVLPRLRQVLAEVKEEFAPAGVRRTR